MVANASLAGDENPSCSQFTVRAVTVPIRPMASGNKTTFLARTVRSFEVKFVFFIRLQFALVALERFGFQDEQRVYVSACLERKTGGVKRNGQGV